MSTGARIRLEELPAELRRQAAAQLGTDSSLVNGQRSTVNGCLESVQQQAGDALEAPWTGREKELQAAVERLLRSAGWKWFHMPGAAALGNPRGWPDLIAFGPGGRVVLIELKTARGVVSDRQAVLFGMLRALGHTVHVCRSVAQVERVIRENV